MAKGLLLDFDAIAHHADGDPIPLLQEIRALGYDVYRREFLAVCDYVRYVGVPLHGHDGAERFLGAVFKELDLKPKKTELMSLAPVFADLHRYALYEDVPGAMPALAKGHRIAVLATLPPFLVVPVLAPVKAHVAATITSKDAKATLPGPKVFETAIAAIKVKAKDVTFAGAFCADIAVAKGLGLRSVFIQRGRTDSCEAAGATLASLDGLEAALKPSRNEGAPPKVVHEVAAPQSR